jgi:uncharacterized tellurite resistance protein B-like protein
MSTNCLQKHKQNTKEKTMTKVSNIGKLILDVFAVEGTIDRIEQEGTAAILDQYEITDEELRAWFTACVEFGPLAEAVNAVWAAYEQGRAADAIPELAAPWEP